MDLNGEIIDIIVDEMTLDEEEVVSEAHLQDDLGLDSVAIMYLAETISKRYKIDIQIDDLVDVENVEGLITLVDSKIKAAS